MAAVEEQVQRTSGCGVQGCLYGAVALFVLLLVAMLVIAVIRFSQPPQGVGRPPTGHHPTGAAGARHALSLPPVVTQGAAHG